jgi:protein-arginine kinase activator protein McsA
MDCDKIISSKALRCKKCSTKYLKVTIDASIKYPHIDDIIKMVKETSYEAVGRKYDVSGAAIKKRIKLYKGDVIPKYNKKMPL